MNILEYLEHRIATLGGEYKDLKFDLQEFPENAIRILEIEEEIDILQKIIEKL